MAHPQAVSVAGTVTPTLVANPRGQVSGRCEHAMCRQADRLTFSANSPEFTYV